MSFAQVAFSPEAHVAPFNSSATLAVEFTLAAEEDTLPCLQAFCTFLGKTHEAPPCSSWSSSSSTLCTTRGSSASKRCSSAESHENEERRCPSEAEGPGAPLSLPVEFELPLAPFSAPPAFCEQLINETITVLLVKTPDPVTDGSQGVQRKEQPLPKGLSKKDIKEKAGKKGGPPRPVVPQGDMRTAEVKAAPLLLLKDGETMDAPEAAQKTLASLPGIVSLRFGIKATKSLLSPELRILLNPVWLLIKEVRNLPLFPRSSNSVQRASNDASENVHEGAGESTPAKKGKACCVATEMMRTEPRHYFARLSLFSRVFETQPVQEELNLHSASGSVCWNFGFLCFWGPAVVDQNELKDFIEEQRLEIELFNTEENLADLTDSEVACAQHTPENRKPVLTQCSAKPQKQSGNVNVKKRRGTSTSHRANQGGSGSDSRPPAQLFPDDSSGFPNELGAPKIKPPHGLACFHLNALSSCRATRLSFSTDVLPVAGFSLVRNEGGKNSTSLCRVNGPDFMKSGTRMVFAIQLAESLFQRLPFQEEEGVPSRWWSPVPNQLFNRIFVAAPLNTPLAAALLQLEAREEALINKAIASDNSYTHAADKAGEREAEERGNDYLTGFIIDDGEYLYSVLEGLADGRLTEAARVLQASSRENEKKGEKLLYNSRLRFSERRYPPLSASERIETNAPLTTLATSRAALVSRNSSSRPFSSGFSKLQLCTLFARAADLKCNDLFPTSGELNGMRVRMAP
ncbi:hypothetical protein Esti_004303 [Eimeria stiedai]